MRFRLRGVGCRLQVIENRLQVGGYRNVLDHTETAIAGSSMISNVSDGDGIPSPASIISNALTSYDFCKNTTCNFAACDSEACRG